MSDKSIKISIIIVNLNTGDVLRESLESLFKFENPDDSYEIIIIDQNSKDNSREIITEFSSGHNNIKYIFNDSLKSFSYANNQGFDISKGDYILIMNPDIIFVEPVIDSMLSILKNNTEAGAVCPLLHGKDGNFQHEYFRKYPGLMQFILFYMIFSKPFYYSGTIRRMYYEISPDVKSGKLEKVEQIPCAFFFTRREVYEKSGKMDDNYVLFYEDVDLSYQVNKKYNLYLDTSKRIVHYGGSSFVTEDNWWLHGRFLISMNYFFDKNYSSVSSFLLKILAVSNSALIVLMEKVKSFGNRKNNYRSLKHSSYLKEFKKVYLMK